MAFFPALCASCVAGCESPGRFSRRGRGELQHGDQRLREGRRLGAAAKREQESQLGPPVLRQGGLRLEQRSLIGSHCARQDRFVLSQPFGFPFSTFVLAFSVDFSCCIYIYIYRYTPIC